MFPQLWPRKRPPATEGGAIPFRSQRGHNLVLRPVEPGDTPLIADFLSRLSPHTIFLRYLSPRPAFALDAAWQEASRLVRDNPTLHLTLVALAQGNEEDEIVGVAEIARYAAGDTVGEVALVVADSYQGQGIGSALGEWIMRLAARQGIGTVQALTFTHNWPVRRLFARMNMPYTLEQGPDELRFQIDIRSLGQLAGITA